MTDPTQNYTLPQMLRQRARPQPNRVAIRQKDFGIWNPITWDDYFRRASHFGLGLCAIGVQPGGHIGIIGKTVLEWVLAQIGRRLGGGGDGGCLPTSPTNEVAYVLEHADIDVVICEDQEQTDKVLAALDSLPRLRKIVVMEEKGLRNTPAEFRDKVLAFSEVEALGVDYEAVHRNLIDEVLASQSLDDIGLMIYTSGSTGKPKGAIIRYGNIRAVAPGIIERLGLDEAPPPVVFAPVPRRGADADHLHADLSRFAGQFRRIAAYGAGRPREVAPTLFLGVPRIWEKLHAWINIRIHETGSLRRKLFDKALAACESFARKAAHQRTLGERLTFAFSMC